ncbi:4Fe-4S dicluster domain-containing protein [Fibrisoma montanum]|uniref:4Fe-4S dicluster domain-containing protein n=1 Tax=Fibrisoma montanum TaxID=2305895 RepID=A0A418M8H1_9BACT|nr:4Fe-4S dicluster domain-containing protein [Fibrisoma montanum]RIV22392.1 4Fe-4S dicluster domain-containing protein [Fibrisoma montanum]
MSYFQDIQDGIRTTLKGLSLTLQHLRNSTQRRKPVGVASDNYFEQQNGLVTLQYPHEQLPIPDNGRYRLNNEIDDCIVCDKCAKVCPVDCITIDAIKATEEVGRASDGSPIRLYAAKFDIDMAKCCYCGLCTVVCPTECLTMEKTFDYSEFELGKLTYHFADLTPEQADEKRALYEQFVREKEELKAQKAPVAQSAEVAPAAKRPVFRPTAKPAASSPAETDVPSEPQQKASVEPATTPPAPKRPVFKPTQKPTAKTEATDEQKPAEIAPADQPQTEGPAAQPAAPKPAFRPTMKPPAAKSVAPGNSEDKELKKPIEKRNSVGSALAHPVTDATPDEAGQIALEARQEAVERGEVQQPAPDAPGADAPKPRPAFRPTMKPAAPTAENTPADSPKADAEAVAPEPPKPRPAFRPTMKPAQPATTEPIESASDKPADVPQPTAAEPAKPKPGFRPTMKPKPNETADDAGETTQEKSV